MIALTTRLNERDETIIQLQEELDAYDRIHRETEDFLEIKSARVAQLETLLKENNIQIPKENSENGVLSPFRRGLESDRVNTQGPEMVNYDGQETYNITQQNIQNAEERISELTLVADNQKSEINRLRAELEHLQTSNIDTNEFVKHEMNLMAEKVKKAEETQNSLKEIIRKKGKLFDPIKQNSR